MLAQGPLRGALQFSPAPPRGLGLQRPSQSRSPNPSKSFSLRVRLEETGEIYRLSSCHGDTTVRELKEELDLMAGIPFHFQCILYLDQGILMDESTLGFHDVVPGGILSMCIWHQDGWQELVLAAMEGDTSKLSCLGVTEDSLYRTPHSTLLRAEKYKEWIADRAFVALYIATHRGHTEAVRFLLENGANCLAKTPVGRTALHVAAAMGHVSCINLLLDYDAVLSEKDLKGETPIEIARRLKRKQSIQAFCMYQMKLRAAKLGSSQSNPHRSASLLFSKGQHIKS
ncbi:ankyrin repeat domain-containing protein 60 [Phascolarctos cinereus]|uniref:Ankyrin repeat domain-containing protein 60 isoform X1 n=1 Tax=Phascolarctos cinereus TaxID=38626 RepID=A0A6P5JRY6_PHACI|nr:ankyrin repeat domain-containing protein 60 isoform X1 [Phascolarctos cinereus]